MIAEVWTGRNQTSNFFMHSNILDLQLNPNKGLQCLVQGQLVQNVGAGDQLYFDYGDDFWNGKPERVIGRNKFFLAKREEYVHLQDLATAQCVQEADEDENAEPPVPNLPVDSPTPSPEVKIKKTAMKSTLTQPPIEVSTSGDETDELTHAEQAWQKKRNASTTKRRIKKSSAGNHHHQKLLIMMLTWPRLQQKKGVCSTY